MQHFQIEPVAPEAQEDPLIDQIPSLVVSVIEIGDSAPEAGDHSRPQHWRCSTIVARRWPRLFSQNEWAAGPNPR